MSRRALFILGIAGVAVAVAAAVIIPLADRAVREVTLPLRHEDIIRQQAAEKNLDPALLAGVIFAESKFEDRTSAAGAEGLMQLTPSTAEYIAKLSGGTRFTVDDLSTPQVNISYGAYYLRWLLNHYHGNLALALAAYNAGVGNVDRWVRTGRARVSQWPFPETRAYIRRVIDAAAKYRKTYPRELGL